MYTLHNNFHFDVHTHYERSSNFFLLSYHDISFNSMIVCILTSLLQVVVLTRNDLHCVCHRLMGNFTIFHDRHAMSKEKMFFHASLSEEHFSSRTYFFLSEMADPLG